MKNWEQTEIKLNIEQLRDIVVQFKYVGEKPIKEIRKSCGCTGYKWVNTNTLEVIVETGFVKSHVHPKLYEQGHKEYTKLVTLDVMYEDNTFDKLKVEATVHE